MNIIVQLGGINMSIHIGASQNEIAETVLLPGDPLRAKYIAVNFFRKCKLL